MVARGVGCGPVPPTWKRDEQDAGDHKGPPRGINRSREARREIGRSVGARADDEGLGGPLWSPGGGVWLALQTLMGLLLG